MRNDQTVKTMFKIDTPKIRQAILLVKAFHFGQLYGSYDYVEHHLFGVTKLAQEFPNAEDLGLEHVILVSLMHDLLEDTKCTKEIIEHYFGLKVAEHVWILSKNNGADDYIGGILMHNVTLLVKSADAMFNMNSSIINNNESRYKKYRNLLDKLMLTN